MRSLPLVISFNDRARFPFWASLTSFHSWILPQTNRSVCCVCIVRVDKQHTKPPVLPPSLVRRPPTSTNRQPSIPSTPACSINNSSTWSLCLRASRTNCRHRRPALLRSAAGPLLFLRRQPSACPRASSSRNKQALFSSLSRRDSSSLNRLDSDCSRTRSDRACSFLRLSPRPLPRLPPSTFSLSSLPRSLIRMRSAHPSFSPFNLNRRATTQQTPLPVQRRPLSLHKPRARARTRSARRHQ